MKVTLKAKVLLVTAAAALLIPTVVSLADSYRSFTFNDAVSTITKNDLSLHTREVPKLSTGVQMYQSQLPLTGLEDAMEIQEEYQDLSKQWNSELSAYRTVYDFAIARQGLELSQRSLSQAENELTIVNKERDNGVATDLDVLQANMSLTNAKKNYENAQMGYNLAERRAQQALGLEMGQESLNISLPSFSLLDPEDYDPETIANQVTSSHESLRTVQYLIRTYRNIVSRIDRLQPFPSGGSPTAALRTQLQAVQNELETNPPTDPTDLLQMQTLVVTLTAQIQQAEAAAAQAPAPASLTRAKEDLKEYYDAELLNAEIQLHQLNQALELLSYSYAEQFRSLENQLALQEEAIFEAFELYNKNLKLLENGLIRPADLEALRLNLESAEFQKLSLEKDYMLLKKEFDLFLKGYMAGM